MHTSLSVAVYRVHTDHDRRHLGRQKETPSLGGFGDMSRGYAANTTSKHAATGAEGSRDRRDLLE